MSENVQGRAVLVTEDHGNREGPGALAPGESFEYVRAVAEEMSARHLGSGTVGVLATPAMISMMEAASMQCAQPYLAAGQTTVGYVVNIRHIAPTPIGAEVRVRSEVTSVDRRRVTFAVSCHQGDRCVGEGEHVRVVIESVSFVDAAAGAS